MAKVGLSILIFLTCLVAGYAGFSLPTSTSVPAPTGMACRIQPPLIAVRMHSVYNHDLQALYERKLSAPGRA